MYNGNPHGGNYYDPNGYIDYYALQNYERKKREKSEIRRLGLLTGAALILFIVIQNVFVYALILFGGYDKYISNPLLQTGADIILSVVGILVPFAIFGNKMKKETGIADSVPLNKPKDRKLTALAIPAGLGICMAANIVTSYVVAFMQSFGYTLSSPEVASPEGVFGFFVSVVRVAVVAAFVEEMSLRGYTMQPLRKYGDTFAIVMSACAFGLMHCNLVQAPFALIVGIGLGYICIKTGSLWLPIAIHALNNLISTCITYLLDMNVMSENAVNLIYSIIVYGFIIIGIPCLFFFVRRARQVSPEYRSASVLSGGEKALAYITNPTMIIAIIVMLYCTSQYVSRQ